MIITHISIFLPNDSSFYRRLFGYFENAFIQAGVKVSGGCRLLTESEMYYWLNHYKPDAIFEMNRVKDDIPILHERGIPHLTWIVDFQGRTQNHIKGSDITYFFDPSWNASYDVGGLQDWLPPGTCTKTFTPLQLDRGIDTDFSFIGHIPKPWSDQELNRKIGSKSQITFEMLLECYGKHLENTRFEIKNHKDLEVIIKGICRDFGVNQDLVDASVYYDLMERTKRLKNRTELLGFALKKSDSVAIYGSQNWKAWLEFKKYYKYFIDCPRDINILYQSSMVNLHDGVSFHFRAIDCMASGGVIFWYDNGIKKEARQGLHNYFDNQAHFYTFREDNFDEVYDNFKLNCNSENKTKGEMINLVRSLHTWDHRVNKIIKDIGFL